jgi:hypothetical protein
LRCSYAAMSSALSDSLVAGRESIFISMRGVGDVYNGTINGFTS